MNLSERTDSPKAQKLNTGQYIELFAYITEAHGISYIALPNDDDDYSNAAGFAKQSKGPTSFSEVKDYSLTPCFKEFSEPFSKTLNLMLYESYMTLIDAGLATTDTPPPFSWGEEGFTTEVISNLAVSAVLLAFDRTVERLAALSHQHEFCQGKAISALWLTRSLNEVISSPEPSMKNNISIALEN